MKIAMFFAQQCLHQFKFIQSVCCQSSLRMRLCVVHAFFFWSANNVTVNRASSLLLPVTLFGSLRETRQDLRLSELHLVSCPKNRHRLPWGDEGFHGHPWSVGVYPMDGEWGWLFPWENPSHGWWLGETHQMTQFFHHMDSENHGRTFFVSATLSTNVGGVRCSIRNCLPH